jgi:hypothetical protein
MEIRARGIQHRMAEKDRVWIHGCPAALEALEEILPE